ncbi:MAG: xanthine dehydrogenase family protein molybdopterin-binding subunit [Anaerolineaceae bacterium]
MGIIGSSINRVDALSKVTGKAKYPGDFQFADQLSMKVLFAQRPHAIIRSINIEKSLSIPGVVAVLTARDVPNNEYGLIMPDQPVLCGPGSNKLHGDRIRFEGDQVALVIAETDQIATQAVKAIDVVYDDLLVMDSLDAALKDDAVLVHPECESNIFHHNIVRFGDTEAAFKQCTVVVEQEYHTPVQEHAFLQPESGVAYLDQEGRITVIVGGQWTHEDQEQIAHALNLPLEKVRVIYPYIGGAFGGREDMSVQIILALAVLKLHEAGIDRPVKIVWSREESIIGHHKRHAYALKAKWGANSEGKILAAQSWIYADGGAYAYTTTKVLGNATLLATGPYDIPNVSTDAYAVYTNNIPGGAFRGFGGPQATFMAEMQVNLLAKTLGMDPVEFRLRNVFKEGSRQSMGEVVPKGVSIREVVQRCAVEAGWHETPEGWMKPDIQASTKKHVKTALGFACGYKNVGFSFGAPENCGATIELYGEKEIQKARLFHAGAEVGQGAHTVFAQFTAEALGLPVDKIELHLSDTATSRNSGSVSASRMTFMSGNAIAGAANSALERWNAGDRPAIGDFVYRPPATSPMDKTDGHCNPNFAYGYVAEAILAEVNLQTGEVSLRNVICADDVGKAINPSLVEGQIEGAVVQAMGYALMENFVTKAGKTLTKELSTYMIPTAMDIPDQVQSVILEYPDPLGPYGARGMGEMPYLPFAPAVLDAVNQATGVFFTSFPLTAEKVLRGLGKIR